MFMVFWLFRVATVTALGRTAALGTTVSGGVLPSTIPITLGAGNCSTVRAMYTGAAPVRVGAFLFVA